MGIAWTMFAIGVLLSGLWALDQASSTTTGASASAALRWTQVNAPTPPTATAVSNGENAPLVQCSATGNCVAVGTYDVGSSVGIYSAEESAGVWRPGVQIASTNGPTTLTSLVCPSLGNCTLVGTQSYAGHTFGFSILEIGGVWGTLLSIPTPPNALVPGAVISLDSLTCPTDGSCELAGSYEPTASSFSTFVATETAGAWDGAVTIEPAGSGGPVAGLAPSSLSCTSPGNCVLVGGVTRAPNYTEQAFAAEESAGIWGQSALIPLPANANTTSPTSAATSVSCPSAGDCIVLGTFEDSYFNTQGFTLAEAHGAWGHASVLPLPSDALTSGQLVSNLQLSCSGTSCGIVGTYQSSTSPGSALFGLLDLAGTTSPASSIALPQNYSAGAQQLSIQLGCSTGSCTAYGSYGATGTLGTIYLPYEFAETGGVWSPSITLPTPSGTSGVVYALSLTCTSTGDCIGGSSAITSNGALEPYVDSEQGGTWAAPTVLTTPANAASIAQTNTSTSGWCAAVGDCIAAGSFTTSNGNGSGYVATETAGTWSTGTAITPPSNANPTYSNLSIQALTCSSLANCTIAGAYANVNSDIIPFVASSTNGRFAQAAALPLPTNATTSGQQPTIATIVCASPGNCTLEGTYLDQSHSTQGFVATESNGVWGNTSEVLLPTNAASHQDVAIGSLNCQSVGSCVLGGSYQSNSLGNQDFVESLIVGVPQRAQEIVLPAGASTSGQSATLTSGSCPALGDCEVVGTYVSATGATLGLVDVEQAGSWQGAVSLPLPSNASTTAQRVSAPQISCLGVDSCVMDASYLTRAGVLRTYAISQSSTTHFVPLTLPMPTNAAPNASATPTNLSCPSRGSCTIIGAYTTTTGGPSLF
ncbi:MAG: hypothetical protein ACP5PJ_06465, partial [Acidimicrobiales bacterium]